MKIRYPLRALFALLVPLTLLLSGCGNDEKQDTPKPTLAPRNVQVQLRYAAVNLTEALGAQVSAGSTTPQGVSYSYYNNVIDRSNYSVTIPTYTYPSDQDFSVTVSFTNVRGTQRAPAGASLKAEILVDGQVRKTVTIDHTTAPGSAYVTASAKILASEW